MSTRNRRTMWRHPRTKQELARKEFARPGRNRKLPTLYDDRYKDGSKFPRAKCPCGYTETCYDWTPVSRWRWKCDGCGKIITTKAARRAPS